LFADICYTIVYITQSFEPSYDYNFPTYCLRDDIHIQNRTAQTCAAEIYPE